ncbi:MAG: 2-dehydro-3-deoxygalactonokinase [Armatimonadota bacterium]
MFIISGDWGSTHCRVRLVARSEGRILGEVTGEGAARLAGEFTDPEARAAAFRGRLAEMLAELRQLAGIDFGGSPAILSGMVGSSIGWRELPYARLPVGLDGEALVTEQLEPVAPAGGGAPCPVALVSGLVTDSDILRGEEMEAVGVMGQPAFAALRERVMLLLPGTHAKHLSIRGGTIVDFRTHLTGELLALLCEHSLLRHSVAAGAELSPAALCAGIDAAREAPLTHALFRVRARQVLDGTAAEENHAFLVGVLLGTELGELAEDAEGWPLLLCAGEPHLSAYRPALEHLGLAGRVTCVPPEIMRRAVVAGHLVVARRLFPCR